MVLLLFYLISSLSGGVFWADYIRGFTGVKRLLSSAYSPPCKGGEAAPSRGSPVPKRRGRGGRSQTMFSECESRTLLVSDHPVCAASVASHHFINGAATPPLQGGECAWPINTSP